MPSRCPACYVPLSRAQDTRGHSATLTPGRVSLCLHCMAVLVVRPDLSRRFINSEEMIGQTMEIQADIQKALRILSAPRLRRSKTL